MKFYKKKPVTIAAERLTEENLPDLCEVCGGAAITDRGRYEGILIATLEGTMRADLGDWIIKGVKGEFYPCKDDIFRASYDPVVEYEGGKTKAS